MFKIEDAHRMIELPREIALLLANRFSETGNCKREAASQNEIVRESSGDEVRDHRLIFFSNLNYQTIK